MKLHMNLHMQYPQLDPQLAIKIKYRSVVPLEIAYAI